MKKKLLGFLIILTLTTSLFGIVLPVGAQGSGDGPVSEGELTGLPPLELPDKGHPKLDAGLNQLVSTETTQRSASFAAQSNIEIANGSVRVIVEVLSGQVDATTIAVRSLGTIETTYQNLLQVIVPVGGLTSLADLPGVHLVRLPRRFSSDVISEGVSVINADDVQSAGYMGAGVKVAILDGGFSGYATSQRSYSHYLNQNGVSGKPLYLFCTHN